MLLLHHGCSCCRQSVMIFLARKNTNIDRIFTLHIRYMRESTHLSIIQYRIYQSGIEFWNINLIYLYLFIVPHKTQFSDHMVTYLYSANAGCFFRAKNKQTSISFYTQNNSYIRVNIHLSISQYNIQQLGIEVWYINLIYLYLFIVLHKIPFLI